MIRLQQLCIYLEELLQSSLYSDVCPNGLQVEGKAEVNAIATAVSASLTTIEAAVEAQVDALIVHHGLFWNRDSYPIKGTKRKKLDLLLKNEISLLAYHIPLDANQEHGNNWKAAIELGWHNLEPFGRFGNFKIGVKGVVKPQSRLAFVETLQNYYDHHAHVALGGREMVSSVALISGGAHKSLFEAAEEGLDCFITGSFDEPTWHQAFEEKINFFALGHSNTEKIGPHSLSRHLNEYFKLPCLFLDIENPF